MLKNNALNFVSTADTANNMRIVRLVDMDISIEIIKFSFPSSRILPKNNHSQLFFPLLRLSKIRMMSMNVSLVSYLTRRT